jgi:hypothetical protein
MKELIIMLLLSPFIFKKFIQPIKKSIITALLEKFFCPTVCKLWETKDVRIRKTTNLAASFRRSNLSFFTISTSSNELEVLSRTEQNFPGVQTPLTDLSLIFALDPLSGFPKGV